MNFAVIATLALTTVSAVGTTANLAVCTKFDECVADNSCATLKMVAGETDATAKNACVLTTKCAGETEVVVATKKYTIVKDKCLVKAAATTAKIAIGTACKMTSECVEKAKCGGTGEASTWLCAAEASCDTDVGDKKFKCESAVRNAFSMAAAAIVAAYAL
jgi:hypothetical protein